ncbi:alpha-E domain-containing protein [bacterium]|nr:alpha-E domain-containing protein [bacterium]MBU1989329.1 alpha-E domain-containing protein [bacterium]
MEQLLTANVATNLYWLGRHLERVETTLMKVIEAYDKIIDVDKDAGVLLYKNFNIDLKYGNSLDFLKEAILGEHSANLLNIMINARENAIICRSQIDTDAFGEIIELHALFDNASKKSAPVDYRLVDTALSLIREIWGSLSKSEHRKNSDNFSRLGKLVEEVDFHLRFENDKDIIAMVVHDINEIFDVLSKKDESKGAQSQKQNYETHDVMETINKKISEIIVG